ncbi:UDP-glycosyltransferase 83A1-like isoform X2 [Nymphaea colorata]|uniref:UDP-glycosyltransferase 83A1-like isoform X2 n=1 Tax=Nymphaea colorata TaxID=210225 RepID=UPI00129DE36E|nr:UDP-glycosyltransferase 83A1-like isoform X2 [Nymphaea colorata]
MAIPHALVIPFYGQGHVAPLMELSHHLADHGVLVTFVYTEYVHRHVTAALPENFCSDYVGRIRLATIPDGLASDEDRQDLHKVFSAISNTMPSFLEELILKLREKDEPKITFVIADMVMGFVLDVAKKLNLPRAAFWPASSWTLTTVLNIPKLIDDGIIDQNGLPAFKSSHLCWVPFGDAKQQRIFFKYLQSCGNSVRGLSHILCNTFEELESPFLHLINNVIPIGPLLAANKAKHQPSSIWAQDWSCIDWLNQQPSSSVIYVSLGSTTVLSRHQLGELAHGLELTGRPFLWVSIPDLMDSSGGTVYPEGFMDRVAKRALIVGWAPQKEILSHPSVACFLTHCGWNSTMEAVSNGVPMLCWPYFADQFLNQTSIIELWRVGLKLAKDDNEIVGRDEIKEKLELVMNYKGMRERVANLKEKGKKATMKGGASARNFEGFADMMKKGNMSSLEH